MEVGNYSLIIDHQIAPSGSSNCAKMLDYYMREGQFEIGGLDTTITHEDRDFGLRNELKHYEDMVDYYSRQGRFEGRNPELPLSIGEVSGGCFSQRGLFDSRTLESELLKSNSHLIKSVVSVRRSEALEMNLATKRDFERLLRNSWIKQVEEWGIIKKEDIRWCAFFHTDNLNSLHCHVLTWDKSGRFGNEAIPCIPKARMERSKERIYEVAYRDRLDEISRERGFLRDYLRRSIERECGREIPRDAELKLEERRENCNSKLYFSKNRLVREDRIAHALNEITLLRPDARKLTNAHSQADIRESARAVVNILREEIPDFDKAYKRYEVLVKNAAIYRGITDVPIREGDTFINPSKAYYRKTMADLDNRLNNAVFYVVNHDSIPEISRTKAVREERNRILRNIDRGIPAIQRDFERYTDIFSKQARVHSRETLTSLEERRIQDYAKRSLERSINQKAERINRIHDFYQARENTRSHFDAISQKIGVKRTRSRLGRQISRTLPTELREEIERTITQGRRLYREGRVEEARELSRSCAQKILRESMTSQLIDREAVLYESAYQHNLKAENPVDFSREVRERIGGYYERNLSNRLTQEMQANSREITPTRGRSNLAFFDSLLSNLGGAGPESSITRGGIHSHIHRSRDANRLRERTLDELYTRSH